MVKPADVRFSFGSFGDWNTDVLSLGSPRDCYTLDTTGSHQFLSLQFFLDKSSYATMFLREVLHSTTDFAQQAALFTAIKAEGEALSEGEAGETAD